jgi:hypothetical protein
MNRKELVRRAANVMRDNNIKKPVYSQKQVIHISDDDGNTKDFVIKKNDTGVSLHLTTLSQSSMLVSALLKKL